jgi:hypothetical protein
LRARQSSDALAARAQGARGQSDNAVAHDRIGTLLSEQNDLPAGEWHFRRALELGGPNPAPLANLALNLMQQGRTSEIRGGIRGGGPPRTPLAADLAHWSELREVQWRPRGLQSACSTRPKPRPRRPRPLLRTQYLARAGRDAEALAIIEAAPALNGDGQLERARLYERSGRSADGLGLTTVEGKRKLAAEAGGLSYDAAGGVAAFYRSMQEFFKRGERGAAASRAAARRCAAADLHHGRAAFRHDVDRTGACVSPVRHCGR